MDSQDDCPKDQQRVGGHVDYHGQVGKPGMSDRLRSVVRSVLACYTHSAYGPSCSSSRHQPSAAGYRPTSPTTSTGDCRWCCWPTPTWVRSCRRPAVFERCGGRIRDAAKEPAVDCASSTTLHRGRTDLADDALRERRTEGPHIGPEADSEGGHRRGAAGTRGAAVAGAEKNEVN